MARTVQQADWITVTHTCGHCVVYRWDDGEMLAIIVHGRAPCDVPCPARRERDDQTDDEP